MPQYSRTYHHQVPHGGQSFWNRQSQIRKAIERCTGIPSTMLEVIELGMEERKKHPLLRSFLEGQTRLPSSQKIIARLLTAPMQKGQNNIAENLFTEYRVSLNSSRGRVEIIATMRLFRKKSFFSLAKSHGVISVRYLIHHLQEIHEYRQDFLLSRKRFVTTKHSALHYNNNIPPQWKSKLAPRLLAPPSTIYL